MSWILVAFIGMQLEQRDQLTTKNPHIHHSIGMQIVAGAKIGTVMANPILLTVLVHI